MSQHFLEILEYRIPARARTADCVDSLLQAFPFQAASQKQCTRCYYDSKDWCLYNKGYVLVADTDNSALLVQLRRTSSLSGQRTLKLDHMPKRADAFPSPLWQQRLTALLNRRVLVPQLTMQCRCITLRYIDAKDKTCLQLVIENNRLKDKNGCERLLGKRIRLLPVQGFGAIAQKVARYLSQQMGLELLNEPELNAGLALLQRKPGKESNNVEAFLKPDMSVLAAMREILMQLLETMERNEQGVLYDDDPEYLHGFRVAIRRTRSALGEIKGVFDKQRVQRFRNDFAWLGQATGPVRDLQVYLGKYPEYCNNLPPKRRKHLMPLKVTLENNLAQEKATLERQLQSQHYQQLKRGWRDFLARQTDESQSVLKKGLLPVKPLASKHIWQKFQAVISDGNNISSASPPDKLHRLRIDCKKLRYLLEFFSSLYPSESLRRLIKVLKKLQDNLGDFHDLQVQMNALRKFQEQLAQDNALTPETQSVLDDLIMHMNDMQVSQRLLFKDCFAQFSSKQHQAQFAALFEPHDGVAE